MARRVAAAAFAVACGRHRGPGPRTAPLAPAALAGAKSARPSRPAQTAPAQDAEVGIRIELVEEQYAFEPDAPLRLVYRLTGDLASLDLGVDTIPTTTVPATTVPATTVPDTTVPAPTDTRRPTRPTDTAVPDATETTVPDTSVPPTTVAPAPLLPLRIQVTNYPPLTAADTARDIDRIIGGDADRDGFGDAIDGIEIADARPLVTYGADGSAILTVDVPTDVVNSVEERLKFETPGLYPIRTELLARPLGGDLVIATHGTVVQRLPGPADSTPLPHADRSVDRHRGTPRRRRRHRSRRRVRGRGRVRRRDHRSRHARRPAADRRHGGQYSRGFAGTGGVTRRRRVRRGARPCRSTCRPRSTWIEATSSPASSARARTCSPRPSRPRRHAATRGSSSTR